jgi:acetyltransferase-like isoleucine patch superfamily enzyme
MPITIEDSCWLATDVFVSPGIIIRNGTVVGARSSVFNSLPAGKICFGTPAVVIKNRPVPFTVNPLYRSLYETDEPFTRSESV